MKVTSDELQETSERHHCPLSLMTCYWKLETGNLKLAYSAVVTVKLGNMLIGLYVFRPR